MRSRAEGGRREAGGGIASVDGVSAAEIVVPDYAPGVADVLAEAAAHDQKVAPVGGGTALALGNPPERVDLILSTERLGGIIDYEPTDLVLSVGAGAKLGDVQAVLGEHGQRLPIDPPGGDEATIGGLIATARWGPLRHSAGTLRDLLIGICVAHPSGTVSRAGGMVVKNVTGYDMPRLYHGSLGTLGVIVSANFKVLPRPRAEATILIRCGEPEQAFATVTRLLSRREPLAALEVTFQDGTWAVAARVEGREQTVAAISDRLAALIAGDQQRLAGPDSASWWNDYVARQTPDQSISVIIRAGVRPRETATLATGIITSMATLDIPVPSLTASPSIGVAHAKLDFGSTGSPDRLAEAQSVLLALADTATIIAAPPSWKRGLDVWGRVPDGIAVMRSLREQFDPNRTLNPGRFAGFI